MRSVVFMAALLASSHAVAAPCAPGDVVLSEIMAGPKSNAYDEWVEVHARNACSLENCELTYSKEGSDDKTSELTWVGGEPDLDAGDYVVLGGRTNTSAGEGLELRFYYDAGGENETLVEPVGWYSSGTLRLGTTDPGEVSLTCNGELLDVALTDVARFDDALLAHCADGDDRGGCTEIVKDASLDPEDNEDPEAWCIAGLNAEVTLERELTAPADPEDGGIETFTVFGTPGREGGCLVRDWPEPLDVRISEIMAAPKDAPEFIELYNRSSGDLDIAGCELVLYVNTDTGFLVEDKRTVLVDPGDGLAIKEGEARVLSAGGDCLVPTESTCSYDEIGYSGLSLPNTDYRVLALECPTPRGDLEEIDRVPIDLVIQGVPSYQAIMLNPAYVDEPTPEDDAVAYSRWCAAGYDACFYEGSGECEAGSPGELAPCPTIRYPDAPFPCRCSTPGGTPPLWQLSGLGLILIRRRRR